MYTALTAQLISRFHTEVATPLELFTHYPNAPSDEPDMTLDLWAKLAILYGDTRQASIGSPGSNVFRVTGRLVAQLFCQPQVGTADIMALVDSVAEKFRAITLARTVFLSPQAQVLGVRDHWYRVDVACPFHHDALL